MAVAANNLHGIEWHIVGRSELSSSLTGRIGGVWTHREFRAAGADSSLLLAVGINNLVDDCRDTY
jgi:predicted GNAT family acetyltransferase